MANRLVSRASGNYTDSAPWAIAETTGVVDSENTTTAISTSELSTPNFTPGAVNVDGVALKFSARAASPSGTFTVTLRNTSLGSDVDSCTVNISDLPATSNGWHFFKFASTQLLITATTYCIKVVCSQTGSQVTLYRSATSNDFSKMLTTDSTAAPAAGDQLIVCGEYTGAGTSNSFTITMDSTDSSTIIGLTSYTDSISVNNKGTMTLGVGVSTFFAIKYTGRFSVWSGGTVNFGTSGDRLEFNSTMTLIMSVASNVDTGLIVQNGGTFNAYGQTVSNYQTLLNTDEAASATVLGVASTSGWANGDEIAIASTTRTSTQHEKRTISTVDSATQVTVTSGLTNAHSGTSPTQAEVIHLTRNVKIIGTSASLQGYVWFDDTSTVVCDSVQFKWLGSATTNKRGVDIQTTTGSCTITGCSFHEFSVTNVSFINATGSGLNNVAISNSVFWSCASTGIEASSVTTGTSLSLVNCLVVGAGGVGVNVGDTGWTVTGLVATSNVGLGFTIGETNTPQTGTISSITTHSNGGVGVSLTGLSRGSISTVTTWRNNSHGFDFGGSNAYENILDGLVSFGNLTSNLSFASGTNNTVRNGVLSSDTTFTTASGIQYGSVVGPGNTVENSTLGVTSGIKTEHTQDVLLTSAGGKLTLRDCLLASATEVSITATAAREGAGVFIQKHDNTAGLHKRITVYGSAITETTTFNTASPSEKLSPLSATVKFRSSVMRVAVANGATVTISVYVRKNGTYNGNAPRLRILANPALGSSFDADATVDTFSVGADTWEQLTGTTAAAGDDGVMEFVVDCDGTAGSIFVDDFSVS